MFTIQDNKIVWGDCIYEMPEELLNSEVSEIVGTATAGLSQNAGTLIDKHGLSGTVLILNEIFAGFIIDDANPGDGVFIREQIDPAIPSKTFYIISKQQINPQLNWIVVKFKDNKVLRLCPFTRMYGVVHA